MTFQNESSTISVIALKYVSYETKIKNTFLGKQAELFEVCHNMYFSSQKSK